MELAREGKGFEEKGSGLWSVRGRDSGSIPFVLRRGFRGSAARKWGHPVCGGCMAMAGVTPPGLSLWEGVEWSRKPRCRVGPASRRGQPRVGTGCPLPRQPCALHQSLCRSQVRCPLLYDASIHEVSSFPLQPLAAALQSALQARLALGVSKSRAV